MVTISLTKSPTQQPPNQSARIKANCENRIESFPLMVALAIAVAAIYGQVTVNDIILARYTADAWRGRVYAVRYFTLFISAGAAVAMISLLHNAGGFSLVIGVNAIIALLMFLSTLALVFLIVNIENRHAAAQPAE